MKKDKSSRLLVVAANCILPLMSILFIPVIL